MPEILDEKTIAIRRGTEIIIDQISEIIDDSIKNVKESLKDPHPYLYVHVPLREVKDIDNLNSILDIKEDSNDSNDLLFLIDKKRLTKFNTIVLTNQKKKETILTLLKPHLKMNKVYQVSFLDDIHIKIS